ncbi:MAG: alpha/beta hydrolase [Pseudomonadota bacterium]
MSNLLKVSMSYVAAIVLATACAADGSVAPSAKSAALSPAPQFDSHTEQPVTFVSNAGDEVEAFQGEFMVPENRGDADSRSIPVRYVRFPTTGEIKGAPIVYLAGGPGGSGIATAKRGRFPLFMAMRQFGDVIALDQRGTGASNDTPECISSVSVPTTEAISDSALAGLYGQAAKECTEYWEESGVDLAGYTTRQSVADLSDLRQHLGADKISLWGISYGSHLALAAMNEMTSEIDRVIIASVEGLDQTVKLPSRTDDYFARLGDAIGAPNLPELIGSVHASLEENPQLLTLRMADGAEVPYLFQKRDMQRLASAMIADPGSARRLVDLYQAAAAGIFEPAGGIIARFADPRAPISFRAMPLGMDRASGISDARLAQVQSEAQTSLLGEYLNFPMPQLVGALTALDLGPSFRQGPISDIPTLVLTGTLDGRTYPDGQAEAIAGLTNAHQVSVVGAGHNVFMTSPEVEVVMSAFLSGRTELASEILLDN